MRAHNLKPGHVLVDPEGHLYEVVGVHSGGDGMIYVWLWPDASPAPNYWQTFKPDEDIVSINSTPKPTGPNEETVVIPVVEEAPNVLVTDGTAE